MVIKELFTIKYIRMNKIPKPLITALPIMGLFFSICEAQVSPAKDNTWELNTLLSDEFAGNQIDNTKWEVLDCGTTSAWGGSTAFSTECVAVGNGYLNLFCTGEIYCFDLGYPHIGYKTGGIKTISQDYDYGYLEIYAQLPGFIDANGVAHADKFWPAFWTFHEPDFNCPPEEPTKHDEIDIIDQCCSYYQDARTTGSGWWDANPQCSPSVGPWRYHISSTPLCNTYHKFGVEWNTDRQIFYFDDEPWYEIYSPVELDPMKVVIDLQLWGAANFDPNTPWPQNYTVAYMRYYKLRQDCFTNILIANNADLTTYFSLPAVKQNITVGTTGSVISLTAGDKRTFRSTMTTTINGDFTVPLNSECNIIPTVCY